MARAIVLGWVGVGVSVVVFLVFAVAAVIRRGT